MKIKNLAIAAMLCIGIFGWSAANATLIDTVYLNQSSLGAQPNAPEAGAAKLLADRYKGISSARLSFDLVNEPPPVAEAVMTVDDYIRVTRAATAATARPTY
ncbi:MAG: hypothetical protein P8014_19465 [Acidihalobacter sp.]|uniref:hypothetical protein n=1 Tax=Acidihalobacter sp. TaxID=1872108 RepID=UPI00307E7A7C